MVTGHQICWTWNTSQICWIEKRPKLDPNREIHIGASRCYEVLEAFKQYHSLIDDTKRNFKHGLLIDLHGRGMDDGVTQIGKKLRMLYTNYLAMNSSDSFTNLKFQFYDFFINTYFFFNGKLRKKCFGPIRSFFSFNWQQVMESDEFVIGLFTIVGLYKLIPEKIVKIKCYEFISQFIFFC